MTELTWAGGFPASWRRASSFAPTASCIYSEAVADAINGHYAFATATDFDALATQIIGDAIVCEARRTARAQRAAGNPVFLYHFSRAYQVLLPGLGSFHSAELPFVWGNRYLFSQLTEEDLPLSAAMQGYWTRYAVASDPNAGAPSDAVTWPAYDAATDEHLGLDLTIVKGSGLRKETCDWIDGVLP